MDAKLRRALRSRRGDRSALVCPFPLPGDWARPHREAPGLSLRRGGRRAGVGTLSQLDPGSARQPHVAGPHPRAHVPAPSPAFWASASFSFKENASPPPFGLRPLPLVQWWLLSPQPLATGGCTLPPGSRSSPRWLEIVILP